MNQSLDMRLLIPCVVALSSCSAPSPTPPERKDSRQGDGEKVEIPALTWQESLPAAPPRVIKSAPGQRLVWHIKTRGIHFATMSLSFAEESSEETGILKGVIQSTPAASFIKKVHDEMVSQVDMKTGHSKFFRYEIRYGKWVGYAESRPKTPDYEVVSRWNGNDRKQTQKFPSGKPPFDASTFLVYLQSWQPKAGDKIEMPVIRQSYFWRNQMHARGVESVKTGLGQFRAMKIEGISRRVDREWKLDDSEPTRKFTIWVSEDERRLPVKFVAETQYGDVVSELVSM